jgi:hypothetical protein
VAPRRNKRANRRRSGEQGLRPEPSEAEWRAVLRSFYKRRQRQKVIGWALLGVALAVAVSHFFEHLKMPNLLPFVSSGLQDVVAGYPVAIALLLVGVILLGQSDEPPSRRSSRR